MAEISFTVIGVPASSGSKRGFVNPKTGRAIVAPADTKKQKSWQKDVKDTAAEAMNGQGFLTGALLLEITYFRPRPKGHYNTKRGLNAEGLRNPYPTAKPDIGKLTRAIEDAMTKVVYRDDAQVCVYRIAKVWGEPSRAMVTVRQIGEHLPENWGNDTR